MMRLPDILFALTIMAIGVGAVATIVWEALR
jgi:hypothetical protein